MSSSELRAAYEQCPTPEVRRLLWEIHRLQAMMLRAESTMMLLDRPDNREREAGRMQAAEYRRLVALEPVYMEADERIESIMRDLGV